MAPDLARLPRHAAASGSSSSPTWPPTRGRASTTGRSPTTSTTRSTDRAKTLVRHPYDDGVWLADASALDDLPDDVTAVVSLCLVGREQIRPDVEHVGYRLIDHADPAVNPNLDFMLADAARTIAALRDEGHGVLLHCVAAQSRTPTVGIAYAMLRGVDRAEALERGLRRAAGRAPQRRLPGCPQTPREDRGFGLE